MKRLRAHITQPKGARNRVQDEIRVGNGREVDERNAIRKVMLDITRCGNRETRLAHSTGTGQGQQAHRGVTQERAERTAFVITRNKTGQGEGKQRAVRLGNRVSQGHGLPDTPRDNADQV